MSDATGLLDTSIVVALGHLVTEELPLRGAISSLTLAELAAGPVAAAGARIRAERQARLQRAESEFEVLSFDQTCANVWPRVYAATLASGRKPRGRRALDLMIATTALANRLPLYTTNPDDFLHLLELMQVIAVSRNANERR
ncbi:MAG: PIN domain-containing protein [Solirubrobacteraceae bacterium]